MKFKKGDRVRFTIEAIGHSIIYADVDTRATVQQRRGNTQVRVVLDDDTRAQIIAESWLELVPDDENDRETRVAALGKWREEQEASQLHAANGSFVLRVTDSRRELNREAPLLETKDHHVRAIIQYRGNFLELSVGMHGELELRARTDESGGSHEVVLSPRASNVVAIESRRRDRSG